MLLSKRNSLNFSLLSFKDIEILYNEDNNDVQFHQQPQPEPGSKPKPKRSPSILQRTRSSSIMNITPNRHVSINNIRNGVVLYFTSLRIVRRTFQDCWTVRSILRSYNIKIDERDLSMDVNFIYELQSITRNKKFSLPAVFIHGDYIGGVEEITRLHENGELKNKLLMMMTRGGGGGGGGDVVGTTASTNGGECDMCGGLRFVVCEQCDGSHKIYVKKLRGFRSCNACSVDGLVRSQGFSSQVFTLLAQVAIFFTEIGSRQGLHLGVSLFQFLLRFSRLAYKSDDGPTMTDLCDKIADVTDKVTNYSSRHD
ncbi:hypothetical protein ACFE04_030829 [Oxalis oulophora]